MSKTKRLLATVLLVAFVLSIANVGFAASFPDVEDTDYEEAVDVLSALGIITGYEDGTFRPDNNITRAEFSAILNRAAALGYLVDAYKGSASFPDVDPAKWYSGDVKAAVDQGIVKGFPDGTFQPAANVTYGEVLTMLLRAMGYQDSFLTGTWPTNFIVKAADMEITKGVSFVSKAPATRGDVALFIFNALDAPHLSQTGYGDEVKWEEDANKTFLSKLGVDSYEDYWVVETGALWNASADVDEDEIKLDNRKTGDDADSVIVTAAGFDFATLLGQKVDAWVNDDDELIHVKTKKTFISDVIADNDDDGKLKMDDSGESYKLASNVLAYIKSEKQSSVTNESFQVDDEVLFILNSKDEIDVIIASRFDYAAVDSVNTARNIVKFDPAMSIDFDDLDAYKLLLDGEEIDVDDLEENDIVAWYGDDDHFYGIVTRESVSGQIERIRGDSQVRISGSDYNLGSYGVTGDAYDLDDYVTAYFDKNGEIARIIVDEEAAGDTIYGYVIDRAYSRQSGLNDVSIVKLLTLDGTKVTYQTEDEVYSDDTVTAEVYFDQVTASFVGIKLDNDGYISEIIPASVAGDRLVDASGTDLDVNKTTKQFTDKNDTSNSFTITASTEFYNYYGSPLKVEQITLTSAHDATLGNINAWVITDKDDASIAQTVVLKKDTAIGSSAEYAVVLNAWKSGSNETTFKLDRAGTVAEYVYKNNDVATDYAKGDVIEVSFTGAGEIYTISEKLAYADRASNVFQVTRIDGDVWTVDDVTTTDVESMKWVLDSDAVAYDVRDKDAIASIAVDSIGKGDFVKKMDNADGLVGVVILVKEPDTSTPSTPDVAASAVIEGNFFISGSDAITVKIDAGTTGLNEDAFTLAIYSEGSFVKSVALGAEALTANGQEFVVGSAGLSLSDNTAYTLKIVKKADGSALATKDIVTGDVDPV